MRHPAIGVTASGSVRTTPRLNRTSPTLQVSSPGKLFVLLSILYWAAQLQRALYHAEMVRELRYLRVGVEGRLSDEGGLVREAEACAVLSRIEQLTFGRPAKRKATKDKRPRVRLVW
jgi:hypothetical protein